MESAKFLEFIIFYPLLLFSLSVHEAAHAWTANRFGDPTARRLGRVTLNPIAHIDIIGTFLLPVMAIFTGTPLIGWGKPVPVNWRNLKNPLKDNLWIAAAGPISNIILAIAFSFAFRGVMMWAVSQDPHLLIENAWMGDTFSVLREICIRGVILNLALAFFNLIPIFPLDGGNIVRGLLSFRALQTYDTIFARYGMFILLVLFFSGVLRYVFLPVLWIAGIFLR